MKLFAHTLTLAALAALPCPAAVLFVGANADDTEGFAFVSTVDIIAGTQINFTDSSWQGNGGGLGDGFRTTEHLDGGGPLVYTAPIGGLGAGLVVSYTAGGTGSGPWSGADMGLSASGDQIFAYIGLAASPTFLGGMQMGGGTVQTTGQTSNTSNTVIPTALQTTGAFVQLTLDNVIYDESRGTAFATEAAMISALADPANWTGDNTIIQDFSTIGPFGIPESTPALLGTLGLLGLLRRRR